MNKPGALSLLIASASFRESQMPEAGFLRSLTPASQANKGVRRAGLSCSGLPSLLALGLRPSPSYGASVDNNLV